MGALRPGAWGTESFQSPLLRPVWVRAPETGGCACVSLQEAEQELLARVQPALGSVGRGYNVALLLRGRETEAPRLVPQVSPRGATGTGIMRLGCCLLEGTFENLPFPP